MICHLRLSSPKVQGWDVSISESWKLNAVSAFVQLKITTDLKLDWR